MKAVGLSGMGKCIVNGSGDFFGIDIEIGEDDYIIAADGGYDRLICEGITPNLVIGDFDSKTGERPSGKNVISLPTEKNETDMDAAVRTGWGKGYREFHLFGGTGGRRFAHTIANIQLLSGIAIKGGRAYLHGENEISTVIFNDSMEFPADKAGYISIFSLSDSSVGVNIEGLKYEIKNGILQNSFALGVSNEFIGKLSRISVDRGLLLVITGNQGVVKC